LHTTPHDTAQASERRIEELELARASLQEQVERLLSSGSEREVELQRRVNWLVLCLSPLP